MELLADYGLACGVNALQERTKPCLSFMAYHIPVPCSRQFLYADQRLVNQCKVGQKILKMVSWSCPSNGWVKINTDGAWKPSLGVATAGGVVRDSSGNWCVGFSMHLTGCSSAILAELWGILTGLRISWERGFRYVIVESDSKIAVDTINSHHRKNCRGDEMREFLLSSIDEMLKMEWFVKVQHQYREGNRVADGLANCGVDLPPGDILTSDRPFNQNVFKLLVDDLHGVAIPRMCPC